MYRADLEALRLRLPVKSTGSTRTTSDRDTTGMSRSVLDKLLRSWFCMEKPHSMVHWADNTPPWAASRQHHVHLRDTHETRIESAVKIPARKTNNQASFGGSILKNNMEAEAAMELSRHLRLDETGLHIVYTNYTFLSLGLHTKN
jgi:hypothetical protein